MTTTAPEDRYEEVLRLLGDVVGRVLALEEKDAASAASGGGEEEGGAGPFRWEDLGPDELARTWRELGEWVVWLCRRFGAEVVPPCWYRHGGLVEEMTALWLAWLGAYRGDARPDEPVRWLDWLARARGRIAHLPQCQVGAHKDQPGPPTHGEAEFAAFVEAEVAAAAATEEEGREA